MEVMTVQGAKQQMAALKQLVAARPTIESVANLAACYFTIGEPQIALPLAEKMWAKDKVRSEVGVNLTMILKDLGRHAESAKVIEEVYWNHSENFYVRLAYAEALLKAGLWSKAWPIYDNARPTQAGAAQDLMLPATVKEWQDETIQPDETLLVINEGGVGDRFSYPRWLPELTRRGINWQFYPYDELFSFYERIFPKERLVKDGDDISPTYWTTAFALPVRLNAAPTNIPEPLYITAKPDNRVKYQLKRGDNHPVIGICWQAAELHQGERRVRSMSEGQMMRLVTSTGHLVNWVNLQFDVKAPYPISNIPISNWEDTAALISNLDGVVTVDTGVMHLAGALRKPIATVLSGNSCWKFLRKGSKDYFYPTAKLYRNNGYGMDDAINQVIAAIYSGKLFNRVLL